MSYNIQSKTAECTVFVMKSFKMFKKITLKDIQCGMKVDFFWRKHLTTQDVGPE